VTEIRFEPFVHLAELGPDRALVAWGGFWFRREDPAARWQIVDDSALAELDGGRKESIGARSEPYGDAVVEVLDGSGAVVSEARCDDVNHVWVEGLEPDTAYRYRIRVDGRDWAAGERWDWGPVPRGGLDLRPGGRSYDLSFRTFPDPGTHAALEFVVMGDYGVGVAVDLESSRRQRRVAEVLDRLVDDGAARLVVSVGDNVYRGQPGLVGDEGGGEDDDWYGSFYQPYRYVLARVPFYPAVGNHDTADTESSDDREQIRDNFHTDARFLPAVGEGRASVDPGLFYRFGFGADVEFVCIDTSLASELPVDHYFEDPKHREWLETALPAEGTPGPAWRIPFSHHPTYCAGPHHPNTASMVKELVPLFRRAGVRAAFAGHEHNFQLSRADGIAYFLSGAGGKLREEPPHDLAAALTEAWASQAHLLHVRIDGDTMAVTPFAGLADGAAHPMTALTTQNQVVEVPFTVTAPSL
jgi:tartrate-resistant acid phosphatase type 5